MKVKNLIKLSVLALSLSVLGLPKVVLAEQVQQSEIKKIKLDINSATVDELTIANVISKKRAKAIETWLDENGPIDSLEQLAKTKQLRIGKKTLIALQQKFTVMEHSAEK